MNVSSKYYSHASFSFYRFGEDYVSLKPRILKELCKAVQVGQPLPTQYGGFVGITLLGPRSISAFLLPLALEYWKDWEDKLNDTKELEERVQLMECKASVAKWTQMKDTSKGSVEDFEKARSELEKSKHAASEWEKKLQVAESNRMKERLELQMCQQAVLVSAYLSCIMGRCSWMGMLMNAAVFGSGCAWRFHGTSQRSNSGSTRYWLGRIGGYIWGSSGDANEFTIRICNVYHLVVSVLLILRLSLRSHSKSSPAATAYCAYRVQYTSSCDIILR